MPDGLGVWFLILWRGYQSSLRYNIETKSVRIEEKPAHSDLQNLLFQLKIYGFALQERKRLFFLRFPQIPPCYSGISDIFFMHAWSCKVLAYKIILNSQVHPLSLNRGTHMQKDWQHHALKRGREQSLEWFCSEPQLKMSACYTREMYLLYKPSLNWLFPKGNCSPKEILFRNIILPGTTRKHSIC